MLMMYTINTGLITGSVEVTFRPPVRLRDPQHLYRTVFRSGDPLFCISSQFFLADGTLLMFKVRNHASQLYFSCGLF
jgi:hypothetical protein